jgi:hypothetical protein
MGGLFSKPKMPKVEAPAPLPVVDQGTVDRQASDLMKRRKGRAATDLTSGAGGLGTNAGTAGSVASQTLLGS